MPNMANIVVKKDNGTTDVTYTALSLSGGDGIPAVWRNTAVGQAASHQPELRLVSQDQTRGKKRRVRSTFVFPQVVTNTTTNQVSVVDAGFMATEMVVSKSMSILEINEMVSQYANLLVSALVKECFKTGYSAT